MAGKTLPGIGDDESGEHDPAEALRLPTKETANTLSSADKTPSRATDRMPVGIPLRTIIGAPPVTFDGPTATTSVDDDKVAEGLKRLRSLDEPLGPIPNSMPTLKEGIPVVTDGPATAPAPAPTPAVMTPADLIRSRGTAHGHALSTPGSGQGLVPMAVDDRLKGTLLGHSLHLPDLPSAGAEENRAPEVRAIAQVIARSTPTGSQPASEQPSGFSHGDARFFESEPINNELEPEHPRSTKLVRGAAIFAAILAVFIVAAVAYSHSQKSDSAEIRPEPKVLTPEGTPAPTDNAAAPAPTPAPAAAAAPTPTPAPTPAPAAPAPTAATPTPSAEEAAAAAAAAAALEESPAAKLKREIAAQNAAKNPPPPTPPSRPRSSHSSEASTHSSSSHPPAAPKPAAVAPGKRKVEEDPDGTLPLTE